MRKFLSIFLSLILFLCNTVFAGGEDKIVYVENGDKYVFVSTENIPKVVDLFQKKLNEQEKKKISVVGNVGYKSLVIGASVALGVAFCYGASKIDDKYVSKIVTASACVLTALGALATFFVPECINYKVNRFMKSTVSGVAGQDPSGIWLDLFTMRDGKEYRVVKPSRDFKGLVYALESVSPKKDHRAKHGKTLNKNFFSYIDACYTDNNEGILINISKRVFHMDFPRDRQPVHSSISRQGNCKLVDNVTNNNLIVLAPKNHVAEGDLQQIVKEDYIYEFDDKFLDEFLK